MDSQQQVSEGQEILTAPELELIEFCLDSLHKDLNF